jgi:hypothetical protein
MQEQTKISLHIHPFDGAFDFLKFVLVPQKEVLLDMVCGVSLASG